MMHVFQFYQYDSLQKFQACNYFTHLILSLYPLTPQSVLATTQMFWVVKRRLGSPKYKCDVAIKSYF